MQAELAQKGVELEERDFFQQRFTEDELRRLLGGRPPADFFSWNSPSFKKLGLRREGMADDEMLRLMAEEPRLIRRPLIQVDGKLIVGTDRKAMEAVFGA